MGRFFDELKRRGVIRVGVAYLVVSWLLLQITDVLISLGVLPEPFGRYLFFVLLLGLPLALILAWAYELTPEGVKLAKDAEAPATTARFGGRKIDFVIIVALSLVIVLLVVDNYMLAPEGTTRSDDPPMVSGYTQLTKSQVIIPPAPSPFPLVIDASRIYFNSFDSGRLVVRQLSQTGGEFVKVDWSFAAELDIIPFAMTPDRSELLISVHLPKPPFDQSLWLWPVVGGNPRRLGAGGDAIFFPDGSQLLYTNGFDEFHLARPDMTDSQILVTVPGRIHWPSISPDGKRIRFTLVTMPAREALWEVSSDGSGLHQVFSDWDSMDQCCGSWTADGKYFVFSATDKIRSQIWAVREEDGIRSKPVQITTGALDFRRPTIAANGEMIFAVGWQLRGELVNYDSRSEQFLSIPGLESLSAEWLAYSRDENWVSYVTYPEGDLWRSRSDGSNRLQLTFPPMRVIKSSWAPDGKLISFEGRLPGEAAKIYIVSTDGGSPRQITAEDEIQWSPTWSHDGESLAFSAAGKDSIQVLDLATGVVSETAGSEGLHEPTWSRDGRYLAAHSTDHKRLMLFDVTTGKWEQLIEAENISTHQWGRDEHHVYFHGPLWLAERRAVYRVSIPDGTVEQVATVGDKRTVWGVAALWVGINPDGAPLLLRDLSIHHIYALDWLPD